MEMLSNGPRPSDNTSQIGADNGFDIVKVLWRWKWLPILGTVLGLGLGYLFFKQQTTQFAATALIQVVNKFPASAIRLDPYGRDDGYNVNRADESKVVGSQKIVRRAAELLLVNENIKSELNELIGDGAGSADGVAAWIRRPKMLKVQPGDKDINTTLIEITYICESQQLSASIVNAIVKAYNDHLTEEAQGISTKLIEEISKAAEQISSRHAAHSERSKTIRNRQDAPVLFYGENGSRTDPFTKAYEALNTRISDVIQERTEMENMFETIVTGEKAGRTPDSLLHIIASRDPRLSFTQDANGNLGLVPPTLNQNSNSEMAQTRLITLQSRLEILRKGGAGDNHPDVKSLTSEIESTRTLRVHLANAEKQAQLELERKMKEYRATLPAQSVPLSSGQRLALLKETIVGSIDTLKSLELAYQTQAAEQKKKAKEIEDYVDTVESLDAERRNIELLQQAVNKKLEEISVLPLSNQRDLKELEMPPTGYLYGPKLLPYLFGGAALGFALLAGIAVLLDFADKSFRTPDEIAGEMGVPVLGHIPAMESLGGVKKANEAIDASICTIHHSKGRVSEAYRSIRTGLFFSNRSGDLKVIQITSPVPGDGKSTLSSNLAVTMAQSGRRVLLIDADFRRPRIAKLFGFSGEIGMATVVAGTAELSDAIHESMVPNLSVMPGGKRPNNPAELLSSQRFADLVKVLREKFDIIVIDTPPLLAVSDPSAVAAVVDGVVLTMRLRRNVKPLANRAAKILESVDANVLGVVINGVSANAGYGYSYSYSDYRYAYRYRYGNNYYSGGYRGGYDYGAKQYLEEGHDVDNQHIIAPSVERKDV